MLRFVLTSGCLLTMGCGLVEPPVSGSGKLITEKRDVAEFTQIEFAMPITLAVRKGDSSSIELMIDDNLISLVTTSVTNGVLHISSEKNLSPSDQCRVTITAPVVTRLSVAGAAEVSVEELSGSDSQLSIAGSGDIAAVASSDKMRCEIAGSGAINVTGTCPSIDISIAGSGEITTNAIPADSVSIEIAGSGTVLTHANKTLDVSIAGSGDVTYSGEPLVKQSVAGSGSVVAAKNPDPPTAEKPE